MRIDSYSPHIRGSSAASASDWAGLRKVTHQFEILSSAHQFIPHVNETLGSINHHGLEFMVSLGDHLTRAREDPKDTSFLLQRVKSAIYRFIVLYIAYLCINKSLLSS